MIDRECIVCGLGFLARPYELKRGKGKFCSLSCSAKSSNKARTGGVKQAYLETKRKYIDKHPEKYKAHLETRKALRGGVLIRGSCEKCGNKKSEAHHDDYSKPLSVRWLCKKHHIEHHVNERARVTPCL